MKNKNPILLKKIVNEMFRPSKPTKTVKSKPTKVNENLSIRVDPYISVELLDDNTIGVLESGKTVLRLINSKSVDKLTAALDKLKRKM
jgi:hypothetical protein